jgi:biotin carboxyl carrier protein
VSHSYTPGLRVARFARVRRERRLPIKGRVLVGQGATVGPDTVVACTELPGNIQTVNLAARLSIDPVRVSAALVAPVGTAVRRGDELARASSLFGLVTNRVESPADGVVESISTVTGQLILREAPMPVEVGAYVAGTVVEVLADEGVVVQAEGAFLQGIFGVGGETHGAIECAVGGPGDELRPSDLAEAHRGCIVVGGAFVNHETLLRARELGVAAVVVGGFDDADLRRLLGRDLGVAITGAEDLGITLIITEGFGRIPMAARTWRLLEEHRGQVASASGATQIRAGVLRPEILVPRTGGGAGVEEDGDDGSLEQGSIVRVIRSPWFGRIGRVLDLPQRLQALESEAEVRVLVVEFADGGETAVVPRANVERIAG